VQHDGVDDERDHRREREHQDCEVETGVSVVAEESPELEVVALVALVEAVTEDAAVVVVVLPSDPVAAIAPHASTKLARAVATTRRRSIEMRRARAARRACTMAFLVSVEVFMGAILDGAHEGTLDAC
jgi:hypothetical protein